MQAVEVDRGAGGRVAAAIMGHPREFVAIVMSAAATITIFVNALFLQKGPHPAPIFATRPALRSVALPPTRVARTPAPAPAASGDESNHQLVVDIQQALSRKGFYDNTVDGIWGAKTDAAVRDFLQAAGLKMSADASAGLLRAITQSTARAPAKTPAAAGKATDPIARLLAGAPAPTATPAPAPTPSSTPATSSKRILAVQRALTDFGYGQLKPTGFDDPDTRVAIEKFEREHGLPESGRISDRLLRELEAMTGRPLE